MWLGEKRGHLSDWVTQRWVQATGRRVDLREYTWLAGPVGTTHGIGPTFVSDVARSTQLVVKQDPDAGLLSDFSALASPAFDPNAADREVVDFYSHTARYELDSWAEWNRLFRPFGKLLALIFSRRLQQLNVPLEGLDTSRGVTSDVLQLVDPASNVVQHTIWLRRLIHTGNILYAGCYSTAVIPGHRGPCIRVIFPLPNGNAIVLMRPEVADDGSVTIVSSGNAFGDPGFYFTVRASGHEFWTRYVRSLRESIRVYRAEANTVRADHELRLWGLPVLRLHYRLRIGTATQALA